MPKKDAAPVKQTQHTDDAPAVKSIARAVRVLGCLGDGVNTLTDIAGVCNLSKSTVHRLLRALENSDLAIQSGRDHRYYLGPLITRLVTNPQTTHSNLVTCAMAEMKRLSELFQETINICVMPALQNIILYEIPSTHDLRATDENRRLGPQYAGAAVRVQMSQLSDDHLRVAMKTIALPALTSSTITDKDVYIKMVRETRKLGYAVSYGEKIAGAVGVAAPVKGYTCPVALGVLGPEQRMKPYLHDVIWEMRQSAKVISENVADIFVKPAD